jgi:hypothetical protein
MHSGLLLDIACVEKILISDQDTVSGHDRYFITGWDDERRFMIQADS